MLIASAKNCTTAENYQNRALDLFAIEEKIMLLESFSMTAQIIISVAVMLLSGFLLTRLTKPLKLPNVTAYIVAGILIGPYCFKIIPQTVIDGMSFLADIALAFIAFGTGEFFKLSTLKKNGIKNVVITLFESLVASALVFVATYFAMNLGLAFSIVLASLAAATAPASTLMTIRQTGAKGDFVDTLLQVVALDDVVGLIAFSVAVAVACASISGEVTTGSVVLPLIYNVAAFLLGGALGFVLKLLLNHRSKDNRLIITLAVIFGFCGVCTFAEVSPLLGCMAMGTVYRNVSDDDKLFKQLNYFSPPILLLFFVRSGANFKLDALLSVGDSVAGVPLLVIGIVYFFVRILGKYGGAYLGSLATQKDKNVRNWLGFALIPQAGVAIGLATLAARTIGGAEGTCIETIILASSVLYELIGPACAKFALFMSKSYTTSTDTAVLITTEQTTATSAEGEMPNTDDTSTAKPPETHASENEAAFDQAAEEYFEHTRQRR